MGTQKNRLSEIREAIFIDVKRFCVLNTLQNKFGRALCRILRMPLYRLVALQHPWRAKKKETTKYVTISSNNWVAVVWRDWARYPNTQPGTIAESGLPIPEDSAEHLKAVWKGSSLFDTL